MLFACSGKGFQLMLDRFSPACGQTRMKFSTKITGVLCLARNPSFCGEKTGAFKHSKTFRFQMGLCSDLHLLYINLVLWLKECYLKQNQQRWDFCEDFTAWHFAIKVRSCEIRKAPNVEPLPKWKHFNYVGSAAWPECPKNDWRGKSWWLHPRVSGPEIVQGSGGVSTSPTLLHPV